MDTDLFHPLCRGRRCDEADERERALAQTRFALVIRSDRKIRDQEAMTARLGGALQDVVATGEDRVEVAEEDNWRLQLRLADHLEHSVQPHSSIQGALRALLNDRPVSHWIGERHAYLDRVSACVLQPLQELV